MAQVFSNFAKTQTVTAITTASTQVEVDATTGGLFADIKDGEYQVLVITNGTLYEVVHLTERVGDLFNISRAQEDTPPRQWPIGSQILAWNTKGTMDGFLQRSEYQPSINIQNYRLFR